MTSEVISALGSETGVPLETIGRLISSSPVRYKVYGVPKKGGRGVRIIAQPAKEVKLLQRLAVRLFLSKLPIHSAAQAYRPRHGIRTNAEVHRGNAYLLKLDFKEFFPSIKPSDFCRHLGRFMGDVLSLEDQQDLCNLFFWRPRGQKDLQLSIGAPSSPFISNTIVYDVDVQLHAVAEERGGSYTRYADDLCFSANEAHALDDVIPSVKGVLRDVLYPHLLLNEAKTVFASRRGNRNVTGVVISNEGQVSLGRDKKRLIRAAVYAQRRNRLGAEEKRWLDGMLAHAWDIEPEFVQRLFDAMRRKGL